MSCPRYDFHIHAKYIGCGGCDMEPAEIARQSAAAGCTAIAITDHVNDFDWIERHRAAPDDIRAVATDIDVFFGVEVNFLDPDKGLALTEEMKAEYGVQVAIGGPHHHYLEGEYDLAKIIDSQHDMHLKTCANPLIDVLVHPYWFGGGSFDPLGWPMFDAQHLKQVPAAYARELGQAAVETNTAIEINACASLNKGDHWLKVYMDYLTAIAETGATFCPGSDAHGYESLAKIPIAWHLAEKLGLDESRIFRPACEPLHCASG